MATDGEFDRRLALVEQAIDRYGGYLQGYLFDLTKQWQDAEDLLSQLFVHVLHRFPEERIMQVGVLRRKAYQLFVDYWRKKQRSVPTVDEESGHEQPAANVAPEPQTEEEEAAFKARFFSDYDVGLSEAQKEALWLHARYGYTHVEISKQLGVPSSTIGDWIKHARKRIAERINDE